VSAAAPPAAASTVLVVRPRTQALAWVEQLAALGVAARALPLIAIEPAPEPARVAQAWDELEALAGAARAGGAGSPGAAADVQADGAAHAPGLTSANAAAAANAPAASDAAAGAADVAFALLVFVSPNAVSGFFDCAAAARGVEPSALRWPARAWAGATGPGTVAALREAGVPQRCIVAPPADAAQFDSEALWARLHDWRWPGRPVWIVRGNGGRDWLGQQLRAAGADLRVLQSYGRAAPAPDDGERALLAAALAEPARWVWMFSSSEAIAHLQALAPGAHWQAGRAIASHPRIAERARALGFVDVSVIAPSPAALAEALAAADRRRAG